MILRNFEDTQPWPEPKTGDLLADPEDIPDVLQRWYDEGKKRRPPKTNLLN